MIGQEKAETLALQALSWLAAQDALFPAFLGSSGLDVATLGARASEPEVLASVLDFLLTDDAYVTGFCESVAIPCELPLQARAVLSGGAMIHWT